ncbi:MAG: glycosyltransferase family 2 protein [Planctomycetota bacterium]|nr:glycosyltransferase family 2 protein [Planctomycetota bacterium]
MSGNRELKSSFGIVVIGRNEGPRLQRCLESLGAATAHTIYVDSGSTDGSISLAHRFRTNVVELDTSIPFCAARARNAGYQRLKELDPKVSFVQFIDADCELVNTWMTFAIELILLQPDVAMVAGWLRERHPDVSIYNRLGDLEWNSSAAGEVDSVGGVALARCDAFDSVSGFDPTVAAGEEPELCQRLTHRGWRILRLDREMATHDLAMTRFSQWWRRMVRAGYGSMDVAHRFRVTRFIIATRRVQGWTIWLMVVVVMGITSLLLASRDIAVANAVLLGMWPVQIFRIALRTQNKGHPWSIAASYAFLMAISFLPQALGQLRYLADRLYNGSNRLIEYKTPAQSKDDPHR